MNKFKAYRNYGVLGAEKRVIYTAIQSHPRAVTSEEISVTIPKKCGWELYEAVYGNMCVKAPWGWSYDLSEVICGKDYPYFEAMDPNMNLKRVRLICND